MIVKNVMQTYKTQKIPKEWKSSPISIKRYLSDWNYVFLTDKDMRRFCKKYFAWFLPTYDAFPYNIQKVDSIRPMWLYIHGGLYIDLDYEITDERFEKLFEKEGDLFLMRSVNNRNYFSNSIMASRPRHPFWIKYLKAMTEKQPSYKTIGKHFTVMNTTGPLMLTSLVDKYNVKYVDIPTDKVASCDVCETVCDSSKSYTKQLKGSSWVSADTKIMTYCMCKGKYVVSFIIFLFLIITFALIFYLSSST